MSPTSIPAAFAPATTPGGDQHSPDTGYRPGLPFWSILFGVIFIVIIWGLWKWGPKLGLGTSTGPLSAPKPSINDAVLRVRSRGAPVLGRPMTALRATIIPLPPPAYVHPPRYDNTSPPYGGSVHPL